MSRPTLAGIFFVNAVDGFVAGICHLFRILRQLDFGNKCTVLILDCRQLVDTAESRAVLGSDQVGANAPGGDGSALNL